MLPACLVALVLMMDVSGSVPDAMFRAQRDGAATAFEDPALHRTIERSGGIAVLAGLFGGWPATRLPWRLIRDAEAARRFAADLRRVDRSGAGATTAIGAAIAHARDAMADAPCTPETAVIDISTDGFETDTRIPAAAARDAATEDGIVINAIAFAPHDDFDGGEAWVGMVLQEAEDWLRDNVATGFVRVARDPAGFGDAMRSKVILEITLHIPPS